MLRTCALCCAMIGIVGLTVGCNNTKDTKGTKPTTTKKDEAVTAYKSQLVTLEKQVDELKAKAEKATADDKAKLEARLKDAGAKRDAAKKKLEELEKAAADKWEAVSKEADSVLDDLKKAVKE